MVPRASRTGLPAPRRVSSTSGACAADVRTRASQRQPAAGRLDVEPAPVRSTAAPGATTRRAVFWLNCSAPTPVAKLRSRSSQAQPAPEHDVRKAVVVADDAAGDHRNALRLQLRGPLPEQGRRFPVPVVEARVAAAGRRRGRRRARRRRPLRQRQLGGEREVPAEPFRRGRERDDLLVRCGEQQLLSVACVEDFVAGERSDLDAPADALQFGRVEQERDRLLEAGEAGVAERQRRARGLREAGAPPQATAPARISARAGAPARHFDNSSSALIASLNFSASAFAAPGSPGRLK